MADLYWNDELPSKTQWMYIAIASFVIVCLFVCIKSCNPDEVVPFDYASELQHCMDESDHQFRVCVDAMTESFRHPED